MRFVHPLLFSCGRTNKMPKKSINLKKAVQVSVLPVLLLLLTVGALAGKVSIGQKYQKVIINGTQIGCVSLRVSMESLILQARRELAMDSEDRLCLDFDWESVTEKKWFEPLMQEEELKEAVKAAIGGTCVNTKERVYTVAIEDFRANFSSMEEVGAFLSQVKAPADTNGEYEIVYEKDDIHINGVLDAALVRKEESGTKETEQAEETGALSGVSAELAKAAVWAGAGYHAGILDIDFVEKVEVFENYVAREEISDLQEAVSEVTKQKESNKIYVVESGDCLSVIAMDHDTSVSSIMALNGLDDADVIRDGQELVIAVPEPDLKLRLQVGEVYEEDYNEEPVIIENDSWYTTKEVVLEEGMTGHRERSDIVVYENGLEISRNMVDQNIMTASVARVVERGTIKPPTYIKPLYGGRFSSGYGRRWGRMHKGVDFACPTGTTVFASSAGTVVAAGYNSGGYGNQVVISHPDGRMTRYAHNSKILVRVGQHVEQGEKIALSGNTGRSTGPHVHFELYVNGSPADPMKYISY